MSAALPPPAPGFLGRYLLAFKRELLWVGVFSFFINLLTLAPTLYMLQVFDRVLISRSEYTLLALTLVLLLFIGMLALAEWLRSVLLVRAGVRLDEVLHQRVFDASSDAALGQPGGSPQRSLTDLTSLRQFITGNGVFALFDTPWTLIYIAVLYMMHPLLGGLGLAFLALLAVLAWGGHRFTTPAQELAAAETAKSNAFLAAKLRHAETVRAMGMGGNLRRLWQALHERQLARQQLALRRSQRVTAFTKFVQYSQQSLVLALGAWLVIHGQLTAGAMVAANALMSNALRPISTLVVTWRQFVDARLAYRRLSDLLASNPRRADRSQHAPITGQVTLHNLQATAPNRQAPILKGLNASIQAGEVVAVVGPSGAGKSTLARCLIGIWPNIQGEVLLDDRPLTDWSRDALGPQVGYLPQDVDMLDGSVADNIARFGNVDPKAVVLAAQRAGVHEMILRLPNGYDTPMAVAGGQLSGGQRQRIGLARALHGEPALVVLDEPSANLDEVGIKSLLQAVTDLKARGATVVMVLHQRNLLPVADRVLQLEDGRITRFVPVAEWAAAAAQTAAANAAANAAAQAAAHAAAQPVPAGTGTRTT